MNAETPHSSTLLLFSVLLGFLCVVLVAWWARHQRLRGSGPARAPKPENELLLSTLREQALISQVAERNRHEAQAAYSSLAELHQTILASLPLGVLVLQEHFEVRYANAFAMRFLNWQEPLDQPLSSLHPGLAELCAQLRDPHDQEKQPSRLQIGQQLAECSLSELPDGGFLMTVVDVTQVRLLEERVRTKRDLELMGEMAAGITHEVKNALATISGHAQMVAYDTDGDHVAEILNEVHRLLGFVKRFMQTSRGEFLNPLPIPLEDWLADVGAYWRHHPEGRGVTVRAPERPVTIAGDRALLDTVLHNLILNAVQAQEGAGSVRVFVRGDEHGVAVVVEDDGPGFSPEVRARMFSPFVTAKVGGNGLGLFQSRKILMEHQGRLEVVFGPPTQVICHFPKDFELKVGHV